jgi:dTDP-4-dehydrorhamnose 3,5-epimerase
MFQFETTPLPNALQITFPTFEDRRGLFTKTFQDSLFQQAGINFQLKESYFSVSARDVIRGMHFQVPPHDHAKIVFCPQGAILDVLLDMRRSSPTFGKFFSAILSAQNHKALYIPSGFAHGFQSLEDNTITYYLVSSEHHGESDTGVLYNSFGMSWSVDTPIVSPRDLGFKTLAEWESPFE